MIKKSNKLMVVVFVQIQGWFQTHYKRSCTAEGHLSE